MKKEKLSLNSVKNVLSRGEMKKIMAGSGGSVQCYCDGTFLGYCGCNTTQDCIDCCEVLCDIWEGN